ncbi:MAG: hypothetical protein CMO74_07515 [Verrucomicrobiales bacterium]|nr:hypothetical protein [Verrucomicrobiales bacterium]|tara:strand:- start:1661 stop:1990 length:330 start_codon:yes stop_codon:yes gene_type:complete
MTPERLAFFCGRLEFLEEEIRTDLDTSRNAAEVVELDTAIGRLSRMDAMQDQQMALELRRRQENRLLRVQNALKRIAQGRYGVCGKCKRPIDEGRLEAAPDIVLCVKCA